MRENNHPPSNVECVTRRGGGVFPFRSDDRNQIISDEHRHGSNSIILINDESQARNQVYPCQSSTSSPLLTSSSSAFIVSAKIKKEKEDEMNDKEELGEKVSPHSDNISSTSRQHESGQQDISSLTSLARSEIGKSIKDRLHRQVTYKSSPNCSFSRNCEAKCNKTETSRDEVTMDDVDDRDVSPCPSQRSYSTSTDTSSTTSSSSGVCELDHSSQSESTTTESNTSDGILPLQTLRGVSLPLLRIEGRREQKFLGSATLPSRGRNPSCLVISNPPSLLHRTPDPSPSFSKLKADRRNLFSLQVSYREKSVSLDRGARGFGFILRGAKSSSSCSTRQAFIHAEKNLSSSQYLDAIEEGGVAQAAGLQKGDFVLTVNGVDVTSAEHERVVSLIRQSGERVTLTVATPVYVLVREDVLTEFVDDEMIRPPNPPVAMISREERTESKGLDSSVKSPPEGSTYSPLPNSSASLTGDHNEPLSITRISLSPQPTFETPVDDNKGIYNEMPTKSVNFPSSSAPPDVSETASLSSSTSISSSVGNSLKSSATRPPPPVPPRRNSSTVLSKEPSLVASDNISLFVRGNSSEVIYSNEKSTITSSQSLSESPPDETTFSTRNKLDNNCDFGVKSDSNDDDGLPIIKSVELPDTCNEKEGEEEVGISNRTIQDHPSSPIQLIESVTPNTTAKVASIRPRGTRRLSSLALDTLSIEDIASIEQDTTKSNPSSTSSTSNVPSTTWSKGHKSPFQILKVKNLFNQRLSKSFGSTPDIHDELSLLKARNHMRTSVESLSPFELKKRFNNGDYLNDTTKETLVETITLRNGKIVKEEDILSQRQTFSSPEPKDTSSKPMSSFLSHVGGLEESSYTSDDQILMQAKTSSSAFNASDFDDFLQITSQPITSSKTDPPIQGILKTSKSPQSLSGHSNLFIPEPDYSSGEESTSGVKKGKSSANRKKLRDPKRRNSIIGGVTLPTGSKIVEHSFNDQRLENSKVQTLNRRNRMAACYDTQTLSSTMKTRKPFEKRVRIAEPPEQPSRSQSRPGRSSSLLRVPNINRSSSLRRFNPRSLIDKPFMKEKSGEIGEVIPPPPEFAGPLTVRADHSRPIVYQCIIKPTISVSDSFPPSNVVMGGEHHVYQVKRGEQEISRILINTN